MAKYGDFYSPASSWCPTFDQSEMNDTEWFKEIKEITVKTEKYHWDNEVLHITLSISAGRINGHVFIENIIKRGLEPPTAEVKGVDLNEELTKVAPDLISLTDIIIWYNAWVDEPVTTNFPGYLRQKFKEVKNAK